MSKEGCIEFDEQLQQFRATDKHLLNTIFDCNLRHFVDSVIHRMYCNSEDAEDAYHEAVIELYAQLRSNAAFQLKCVS